MGGDYLFCRINETIYILWYYSDSKLLDFSIIDMAESQVSLITFQDNNNNNNLLIVGYINKDKEVILKVYNILTD